MAKKAISKAKANLIKKIKYIIKNYGAFTPSEVGADSSPVIASLGKDTHQLAEVFYLHKVEAIIYVHENETSTNFIPYEDLSTDVLKEILELTKVYE